MIVFFVEKCGLFKNRKCSFLEGNNGDIIDRGWW